jgi:microcystin-dependent protein
VLLLVEGVFFILFCLRGDFVANAFTNKLDAIVADAAVASAAVGTIVSGSDAVVDNFAGLKDLVDELSAFALLMKSNTYYAPVGLIAPFGGLSGSIPAGWFLCDGSAKSTTTYADLYAVLGANAYGTDAGGNFYLPDLLGRVPFGYVASSAQFGARTSTEGTATATARSTAHSHTTPDHSHGNGDLFAKLIPSSQSVWYGQSGGSESWTNNWNGGGMSLVNNATGNGFGGGIDIGGSTSGSGVLTGSTAANPVPYAVANYIIKW